MKTRACRNPKCFLPTAALFLAAAGASLPAGPLIQFSRTHLDFGKVFEGQIASNVFDFQNTGDADLEIQPLKTSCDCTVASVTPDRIKPGGKGVIAFSFDFARMLGPVERQILVPCNDSRTNAFTLTLKADVAPLFEYEPRIIYFGSVAQNEKVSGDVKIKRLDGKKLTITAAEVVRDFLHVTILTNAAPRADAATLVVAARPKGKPGGFSDLVRVFVDNSSRPQLLIPVAGQLTGGLQVEPAELVWEVPDSEHWPEAEDAPATIRSLVLTAADPEAEFKLVDFESSFEDLLVQVDPVQDGKKYRVLIKLAGPLSASQRGHLNLTTSLSESPEISVPITINVMATEKPNAAR